MWYQWYLIKHQTLGHPIVRQTHLGQVLWRFDIIEIPGLVMTHCLAWSSWENPLMFSPQMFTQISIVFSILFLAKNNLRVFGLWTTIKCHKITRKDHFHSFPANFQAFSYGIFKGPRGPTWKTWFQLSIFSEGAQRRCSTGACAKGMPRNSAKPRSWLPVAAENGENWEKIWETNLEKTGKKIWEKGWTKGMASNFTKNQRAEAMKVGILAIKIALNQPFDQDILVIWHV